jgi:hypothetical protein
MRECVLEKWGGLELEELVSSEELFVLKTGIIIYLELRGNYSIKNASRAVFRRKPLLRTRK